VNVLKVNTSQFVVDTLLIVFKAFQVVPFVDQNPWNVHAPAAAAVPVEYVRAFPLKLKVTAAPLETPNVLEVKVVVVDEL
jgi:hypothetical protein